MEASSYRNIFLSLGLDKPQSVVFATDSPKEAEAATAAGWAVALVARPGNAALAPEASSKHRIVKSMDELISI